MRHLTTLYLCGLIFFTQATLPAEARTRWYSKDYLATCYNDSSCSVITFSLVNNERGRAFHHMEFKRPIGADANDWAITIATIVDQPDPSAPLTITVDGKPFELIHDVDYKLDFSTIQLTGAEPLAGGLFAALRTGERMALSYTRNDGTEITVRHSIRGLNAALNKANRLQDTSGSPWNVIEANAQTKRWPSLWAVARFDNKLIATDCDRCFGQAKDAENIRLIAAAQGNHPAATAQFVGLEGVTFSDGDELSIRVGSKRIMVPVYHSEGAPTVPHAILKFGGPALEALRRGRQATFTLNGERRTSWLDNSRQAIDALCQ